MPLVQFRPTKARLVIEEHKDSVLVMKVAVAEGDSVELAAGGRLEALGGVLRIRERKGANGRTGASGVGSIVYIEESGDRADASTAKFQINIAMATEKFEALLGVAITGRLPVKFFIEAGERVSKAEPPGLDYRMRSGGRTKVWDTQSNRMLRVTNFSMILPIDVPELRAETAAAPGPGAPPPEAMATNVQVAELVDDLLVFQSETRHTLIAVIGVVAVLALVTLTFGLVLFFR
jgi:hypothetical protein